MEFSRDSGIIINQIIPRFSSYDKEPNFTRLAEKLYYNIEEGEKYCEHIYPIETRVYEKDKCHHSALLKSHFVPEKIKKYISEEVKHQIEYKCVILNRKITITIDVFNHEDEILRDVDKYENYISFICIHIYIFAKLSRKRCSKSLDIYLSPTHFKKSLPSSKEMIIGVENVNSAVTTRCSERGEMIIYRKEEWLKVFIHEAIHSFGLDIDDHISNIIQQGARNTLPVQRHFNVSEAYTETWARILNAAFCSYQSSKRNAEGIVEFMSYFHFSLNIERIFSVSQLHKVLRFMNRNNKEDTNTNVFAYYILTGVLMCNYNNFMVWCDNNNKNFLDFENTPHSAISFLRLIHKSYLLESCDNYHNIVNKRSSKHHKFLSATTRMSAIQLSF